MVRAGNITLSSAEKEDTNIELLLKCKHDSLDWIRGEMPLCFSEERPDFGFGLTFNAI